MIKSKTLRICIGVWAVILLTLIFIRVGVWERWFMVVMTVVMSLLGYFSKRFGKDNE
jgi:uncharacterized membrane protein